MQTITKSLAVGILFLASTAGAAAVEKAAFGVPSATCSCKGKGDCTCPRGECKCKNCGNKASKKVFETLKGAEENTRLPDTARYDARGGVFI
ncbi:MAG: hypothetical protein U0228_32600 [Myxococcaceae bacterium]